MSSPIYSLFSVLEKADINARGNNTTSRVMRHAPPHTFTAVEGLCCLRQAENQSKDAYLSHFYLEEKKKGRRTALSQMLIKPTATPRRRMPLTKTKPKNPTTIFVHDLLPKRPKQHHHLFELPALESNSVGALEPLQRRSPPDVVPLPPPYGDGVAPVAHVNHARWLGEERRGEESEGEIRRVDTQPKYIK